MKSLLRIVQVNSILAMTLSPYAPRTARGPLSAKHEVTIYAEHRDNTLSQVMIWPSRNLRLRHVAEGKVDKQRCR